MLSPIVFDPTTYAAMNNAPWNKGQPALQKMWLKDLDIRRYPNCTQGILSFSPNAYFRLARTKMDMNTQSVGRCMNIVRHYVEQGMFQDTKCFALDREAVTSKYSKATREGSSLFPASNVWGWKTVKEAPGNVVLTQVSNPEGIATGCMQGSGTPDNSNCLLLQDRKFPKGSITGMPTYTLSFWYRGESPQVLPSGKTLFGLLRYGLDPKVRRKDPISGLLQATNEREPAISLKGNSHLYFEFQLKYKMIEFTIPMPFGFHDKGGGIPTAGGEWSHLTVVVDRNGQGMDPVAGGKGDQNTAITVYKDGVAIHTVLSVDGPPKVDPAQPKVDGGGEEKKGPPEFRFLMTARAIPNAGIDAATGRIADIRHYPGSPLNAKLVHLAYKQSLDRWKFKPVATPPTTAHVDEVKVRMAALKAAGTP